MKYFKTKFAELEKGCEEWADTLVEFQYHCGEIVESMTTNYKVKYYCKSCKAKIQQLKECEKEVKKAIERVTEGIAQEGGEPITWIDKKRFLEELGISTGDI